jgi:hypothetical protein
MSQVRQSHDPAYSSDTPYSKGAFSAKVQSKKALAAFH